MPERLPKLIAISGPNGAGKSTLAPFLLRDAYGSTEFVNADTIAQGLSAFSPETVAFEAGRIMLRRLRDLAERRISFAFETTLASRSYAPWIAGLLEQGYEFNLMFLWLRSPDLAVQRVKERVRAGGHDVPEQIVRRRYFKGINNFFRLYQALADSWGMYDNSNGGSPQLIAKGSGGNIAKIYDEEAWQLFTRQANE
ncbi:MAG: zeta toxin family protein [Rubrivivax sp.]|nr:zeta toxin family protein [Pyrinomonadaceae bacterium]